MRSSVVWDPGSLLLPLLLCVIPVQNYDATQACRYQGEVEVISGENVLLDKVNDGGIWRVFQRKSVGNVSFDRNWTEYKNGFGTVSATEDFWLGLDKIHGYCGQKSDNCQLRIDMMYNSACYHATYAHFYIDDETNKYRIHFRDYSGNAGDSLRVHDNMAFTTRDQDNDLYGTINCAQNGKCGWWYNVCFQANLNLDKASFNIQGVAGTDVGLNWRDLTGESVLTVTFSEMKMRKVQKATTTVRSKDPSADSTDTIITIVAVISVLLLSCGLALAAFVIKRKYDTSRATDRAVPTSSLATTSSEAARSSQGTSSSGGHTSNEGKSSSSSGSSDSTTSSDSSSS